MMEVSKGKYWDRAWSLVEGCTPVSDACENCWLRSMNDRFKKGNFSQVRIRHDRLSLPLRTRKPTVWAVWSDLFHESVPISFIAEAFCIMASATLECNKRHEHEEECWTGDQHTFLILTKRPERMREVIEALPDWVADTFSGDSALSISMDVGAWPLENVWLGTTVENQRTADERIPHLLEVPGNKFLSIEPMLGPVNLECIGGDRFGWGRIDALNGLNYVRANALEEGCEWETKSAGKLNCIILGGESGPKARPMHPDWVRSVRDQCQVAGVLFFFKQWGEWSPLKKIPAPYGVLDQSGNWFPWTTAWNGITGKESETNEIYMYRVGKKSAGRILDGRTHDDLPWSG